MVISEYRRAYLVDEPAGAESAIVVPYEQLLDVTNVFQLDLIYGATHISFSKQITIRFI